MSKLSLAALMTAVVLIVLAVMLDVPFLRGGSGVFLLAGLAYAYVVAKREVELLTFAVKQGEDVYELETVYEGTDSEDLKQVRPMTPAVGMPQRSARLAC